MLIAEADTQPEWLENAILRYRKKKVGDVIPPEPDAAPLDESAIGAKVISIEKHGPGRRSGTRSA